MFFLTVTVALNVFLPVDSLLILIIVGAGTLGVVKDGIDENGEKPLLLDVLILIVYVVDGSKLYVILPDDPVKRLDVAIAGGVKFTLELRAPEEVHSNL